MSHGHPVVDAAWKELCAIHQETGGGNAITPNMTAEYAAALRVFKAALDAHREIIQERAKVALGMRSLRVVKG